MTKQSCGGCCECWCQKSFSHDSPAAPQARSCVLAGRARSSSPPHWKVHGMEQCTERMRMTRHMRVCVWSVAFVASATERQKGGETVEQLVQQRWLALAVDAFSECCKKIHSTQKNKGRKNNENFNHNRKCKVLFEYCCCGSSTSPSCCCCCFCWKSTAGDAKTSKLH